MFINIAIHVILLLSIGLSYIGMLSFIETVMLFIMDFFDYYTTAHIKVIRSIKNLDNDDNMPPHIIAYKIPVKTNVPYIRALMPALVRSPKFQYWVDHTIHRLDLAIHNIYILSVNEDFGETNALTCCALRYVATDCLGKECDVVVTI